MNTEAVAALVCHVGATPGPLLVKTVPLAPETMFVRAAVDVAPLKITELKFEKETAPVPPLETPKGDVGNDGVPADDMLKKVLPELGPPVLFVIFKVSESELSIPKLYPDIPEIPNAK
jgi:hypothetical protein